MQKTRLALITILALFLPVVAIAGPSVYNNLTSTTTCQNVTTSAVTVLAADVTRVRWAIWTTSGAATIYWNENGAAVAKASTSGPLVGGDKYWEDEKAVTKAVSAITASGTAWVCAKSVVDPS